MASEVNVSDLDLLRDLAEFRIMTQGQIAARHFGTYNGARRRIEKLRDEGLIERSAGKLLQVFRGGQEIIYSVSTKGVDRLREEGMVSSLIPPEKITANSLGSATNHQLLLGWARIHLDQIPVVRPDLSVRFIASNSPFALNGDQATPLVYESAPPENTAAKATAFTPDGVFTIASSKQGKSLLFFLEIDMGTEPLSRNQVGGSQVRQKIVNYRDYFQRGRYKRYEEIFQSEFTGFRLLFLADDPERMASLCGLVRAMTPANFIWLTDRERMFEHGLAEAIWAAGGRQDLPERSILGDSLSRPSPLDDKKLRA
jgi:hypothetical protein